MTYAIIVAVLIAQLDSSRGRGPSEARSIVEVIESLQHPCEDFRCEYEGTIRHKGPGAVSRKLGEDGLYDTFSGIFIWRANGDTYNDIMHRIMPNGAITRESLAVRMKERQAEQYSRANDAPQGLGLIENPKYVNSYRLGCLGKIFFVDKLKREVADDALEFSVGEEPIEGGTLKILTAALRGVPDSLMYRYWIDLRRSGHVVRYESYGAGKVLASRTDVKLKEFKIGDRTVWMPIFGELIGYMDYVDKKRIVTKEPTILEAMYIIDGTLEFNKRPGRETFSLKYKSGTPISDHLRQMSYEFGRQKISPRPTKVEVQKMLNEQVATAEAQKAELIVVPPSQQAQWLPWIAGGLGAAVLVSLIALQVQRRMR